MSYHSYSASGPIEFSTFDIWANNVSSDTNAGIDNALSDWYPAQSAPYQASTLLGTDCFYGTFVANTGGTISISTGAMASSASSTNIVCKNMDLGVYNPSVVASATYPYSFHSWRTGTNGGGSQVTTSATLTVTTGTTQATTYYAYFTTTHVTP